MKWCILQGVQHPGRFAPSRGRELKSSVAIEIIPIKVRPLAGAGIEIHLSIVRVIMWTFAPSRGRELKWFRTVHHLSRTGSPPRGGGN